jgi:hypothetical protein
MAYVSGMFVPKNPEKYIGGKNPQYRSSWELSFMHVLDSHPFVLQWASEFTSIPYRNPFTGKQTVYIPDFLVIWVDKYGNKNGEIIEIKPANQVFESLAKRKKDQAARILNMAKWSAANYWAKKHGLKFRVMTENELYVGAKK